jgi:hypothetical protein
VPRIEVGENEVVGGEDEEKYEEKEWYILSGTWKEERMDAVSSFVAAVQRMGELMEE